MPLRAGRTTSRSPARAMLLPHDWRDRPRRRPRLGDGHRPRTAAGASCGQGCLRASRPRPTPRPRGRLPAPGVQPPRCSSPSTPRRTLRPLRPVARAIWVEPAIIDPHAPPRAASAPPRRPTRRQQPPTAPLISVLTPVHDPPPHMLEEAIASVRSPDLHQLGALPGRRRLHQPPDHRRARSATPPQTPASTSTAATPPAASPTATNAALELATGQYIALLDHDDTLTPDALQHVADQIATDPDLDMIYSDEDVVGDDRLHRATSQARLVARAHDGADVHVPSRRLPADAGRGARRLRVAIRRLPGL